MKTLFRLLRRLVVLVCIAAVLLTALPPLAREADRLLYPRKYSRQVEQWAAEYELDPLLVYAFIRTESGFDPAATSSVEARGLMQMTEETFIWLRSKIAPDEGLTFDDLYDPDSDGEFHQQLSGEAICPRSFFISAWSGTAAMWLPLPPPTTADGGQ